jgi:hypothetical protein
MSSSSSNNSSSQEIRERDERNAIKMQEMSSQWAEVIGQLVDRLTGKETSITYTFDNLTVDMPRAQGPNGQDLGNAQWTINGKVVITAEAHDAVMEGGDSRQRSLAASSTA